MAPVVTPIPVLKVEGPAGLYQDRVEIGGRDILRAVREVIAKGQDREHCGGEQWPCGLYQLVLSAVPS